MSEKTEGLTMMDIKKAFIRANCGHSNIHFSRHLQPEKGCYLIEQPSMGWGFPSVNMLVIPEGGIDELYDLLQTKARPTGGDDGRRRNEESNS